MRPKLPPPPKKKPKKKPVRDKVLAVVRRPVEVPITDPDEPDHDPQFSKLTNQQKARFDRFVAEYVFDYNGTRAVMRMGYEEAGAGLRAHQWLKTPYVQYKLKSYVAKLEDQTLCTRGYVVSMLVREANYYGPDGNAASRVAACRQLAKALGLNVLKVEQEVRNFAVMEVPMIPNSEEWSKHATESQRELKERSAD